MQITSAVLSLALQAPFGMTEGQVHWLIGFTALTAVAVLVQAVAFGAMAYMVVKLMSQVSSLTSEMKGKIYPVLDNVREVLNDSVPKIKRVTDNIADTSDLYRARVADVDDLIADTTRKARQQSDRMDNMMSNALTSTGRMVGRVENAILAPIRQGAALLNGVKAAMDRMAHSSAQSTPRTPKPVAFEGENIYTGIEDDYHA